MFDLKSLTYKFWDLCMRMSCVKGMCRINGKKLEKLALKADKLQNPTPPRSIQRKFNVTRLQVGSQPMFKLCPKKNPTDMVIFHVHGGAYLIEMNAMGYGVEKRLIRLTGATVYTPIYPLAPQHNCIDAIDMLTSAYKRVLKEHPADKITILGESAGAQLVLSLCQQLRNKGLPQPKEVISVSPPTELEPSPELFARMKLLEKRDCMLSADIVPTVAKWWLRDTDNSDWRANPIYGDFSGLAPISIFCGTAEIFYAQVHELMKKIKADGARLEYFEGPDMMHTWTHQPISKESRDGLMLIAGIILR